METPSFVSNSPSGDHSAAGGRATFVELSSSRSRPPQLFLTMFWLALQGLWVVATGGCAATAATPATAPPSSTTASSGQRAGAGGVFASVSIGSASVSGGGVENAWAVVSEMARAFRRCYNDGLKEDPAMEGAVRITALIGPAGEVTSTSAAGNGGLSGSLVSCAQARVASARFASPEGGSATIVIPVTFAIKGGPH